MASVTALLIVACLATALAQASGGLRPINATSCEFPEEQAAGEYVRCNSTLIQGSTLLEGAANVQASFDACTATCSELPHCSGVNFCADGPCLLEDNGGPAPAGACQLVNQATIETGQSVVALAAGRPELGTAGVKLLIDAPSQDNTPPGYDYFFAQAIPVEYGKISCEGSLQPGVCLLQATEQEMVDLCDALSQCQGVVLSPFLAPTNTSMLVGALGSTGTDKPVTADELVLNAVGYTYLKMEQNASLPAPATPTTAEAGGRLSSGAIAGIVVGSLAAVGALVGAALLFTRRKMLQNDSLAVKAPSSSGALQQAEAGQRDLSGRSSGEAANKYGWGAQPASCGESIEPATIAGQERLVCSNSQGSQPSSIYALSTLLFKPVGDQAGDSGDMGSLQQAQAAQPMASRSSRASSEVPSHPALLEDSWEAWIVSYERIEFCKNADGGMVELGVGGYGKVYKVLLDGYQPLAAKVIELGGEPESHLPFIQEVAMLRRLRHRNIVGFSGVCVHNNKGIILMELMEGRDLRSLLGVRNKSTKERLFGWYLRGKHVALDVALGLAYLHSLQLSHLDIKSANILLTKDYTAKVGDVGLARMLVHTYHSMSAQAAIGTFAYMPPELVSGEKCNQAADIYSWGVLLWEICSGEHPVRGRNRDLHAPEDCPQGVIDLCKACTSKDPAARPTAKELVERLTVLARISPPTARRAAGAAAAAAAGPAAEEAGGGPRGAAAATVAADAAGGG